MFGINRFYSFSVLFYKYSRQWCQNRRFRGAVPETGLPEIVAGQQQERQQERIRCVHLQEVQVPFVQVQLLGITQ